MSKQLVKQIAENHFHNANLENLILTLKNQLDNTKGKKVYGYLKPEVKKTVDEIFRILSQEKNISELYEKWCELERQKYKTYTQKEKEIPSAMGEQGLSACAEHDYSASFADAIPC